MNVFKFYTANGKYVRIARPIRAARVILCARRFLENNSSFELLLVLLLLLLRAINSVISVEQSAFVFRENFESMVCCCEYFIVHRRNYIGTGQTA